MSKRKAFNFYLSYFETAMMLNNTERLQFYDALMQKQFNGIEPIGLKGGVNFAWVSQKHSIDAQVEGWENKTKLSLQDADNQSLEGGIEGGIEGGTEGGTEHPSVQEKEKEKGKEKGKGFVPPTFIDFEIYCKENGFKNIAERAFKGYSENEWKDSKGNKVLNWKSKLQNVWFDEKNKDKQNSEKLIRCIRKDHMGRCEVEITMAKIEQLRKNGTHVEIL